MMENSSEIKSAISNITENHYVRSPSEKYLLILWSVVSLVVALAGNTFILMSVVNRAFRIDKFSLLVIKNLAVSDVYFNIVWVLPTLITLACDNEWVLGSFLCSATTYLQYPPAIATIFFITLLSCNKWVRIKFPLRTLDMTTALAYKITVTVWGLAFIHPTVYMVSNETMAHSERRIITLDYYKGSCDYNHDPDLVVFWNVLDLVCAVVYCLLPSIILVASNIAIIKIVKSKGRGKIKRTNFFMIIALTYIFLVSYTPYTIKYLIPMLRVDLNVLPVQFIVLTYFLLYVNSWANPCIYFATNQSFRSYVIASLRRKPLLTKRYSSSVGVMERRTVWENARLVGHHRTSYSHRTSYPDRMVQPHRISCPDRMMSQRNLPNGFAVRSVRHARSQPAIAFPLQKGIENTGTNISIVPVLPEHPTVVHQSEA